MGPPAVMPPIDMSHTEEDEYLRSARQAACAVCAQASMCSQVPGNERMRRGAECSIPSAVAVALRAREKRGIEAALDVLDDIAGELPWGEWQGVESYQERIRGTLGVPLPKPPPKGES